MTTLLALLLAAVPASPSQPAGWPAAVHWKMTKTAPEAQPMECEVWMTAKEGRPVKMRGVCRSGPTEASFLIDGQTAYTWGMVQKRGLKMESHNLTGRDDFPFRMFFVIPDTWHSMKWLGSEAVGGEPAEHYEVMAFGRKWEVWQSARLHFPLKYSSGANVFVDSGIEVGGAVPQDGFAVPADVQFRDLDEALRQRGGRRMPPAVPESPRVIDADTEPPRLIRRVELVDPYASGGPNNRAPGGDGSVILEGVVDEAGFVREARVVRSVDPRRDASAIRCVRQWRYEPARRNGCPVAVLMSWELAFPPTPDGKMRP